MKRRWIGIIIGVYALVYGIIAIFSESSPSDVSIVVVKRLTSQVMTRRDEWVPFYWFLSEKDTFLTDEKAITNAQLYSDENELDVAIESIIPLGLNDTYEKEVYEAYQLNVDVSEYFESTLGLSFSNAILKLTYENSVEICLNVGDVFLSFSDLVINPDFDFFRLKGCFDETLPTQPMTGIMIGFDQFKSDDLTIISITAGVSSVRFNLEERNLDQTVDGSEGFSPTEGEFLVLSLNPLPQLDNLSRFALVITYRCEGEIKQWIMDDFMFRSPTIQLVEGEGLIEKQIYQY